MSKRVFLIAPTQPSNHGRSEMMRVLIFTASVFAAVCIWSGAAHAQTNQFDGTWRVRLRMEWGNCNIRGIPFSIVVQNGRPRGINVPGQIAANGAVRSSISRGPIQAIMQGQFAGQRGHGTWSISGSHVCTGQWNAERQV